MSKFVYRAKDWTGKTVRGVLDMATKAQVVESIKSSGLVPLMVEVDKDNVLKEFYKRFAYRIKFKDITSMTRQLSTMMTAGLPLTDALQLLKNQLETNPPMYEILDYCLNQVRGGQPLGKSMIKYENIFGEAYIASISAGEEAGVLEEILTKLATNMENQNEFNGKVKGAMIYPMIVVIGMIAVAFVMMIFVIPKLTSLYTDFGSKMPASTQLLMSMSNFATRWWFLFPIFGVGLVMFSKVTEKNPGLRLKVDLYKLKIPILGELNRKTMLANTLRTMSMLLAAGISLVEVLRIVSKVAGNEVYYRSYVRIAERVQKGFSVSNSFEETGVFPLIVEQMVSTGEATGKLDEVLLRASDYFATEAEQSVKALTSAIEPIIMIILGLGVAFLVVAVIMPIYNLTSQF
ncbi:type II secretion system F family protein [Candidatus Shapirobacteria bacterium]|nr:type II secretion system F family protein [Candidatus Shapirobacteria bacterium]